MPTTDSSTPREWAIERNGKVVGYITSAAPPSRREVMRALAELDKQSVLPKYPEAAETATERAGGDVILGNLKNAYDFTRGLGASGARTVYGLADQLIREPLGLERPIETPAVQALMTAPATPAGRAGSSVGDVAQFFAPTGIKKYQRGAQALQAGAVTLGQTGSPRQALASAGTALIAPPVVQAVAGQVKKAAAPLAASAEKKVVQALGASKERYKAMANRLAPQLLQRGIRGSRESILARSVDLVDEVGTLIDDALATHGADPIAVAPVLTALEKAKDAFRTVGMSGKVVEFEPRTIKQLAGLQQTLSDLGSHPTVNQLVAIRRAWDRIVDQAGGFSHRAGGAIGVPLREQSEAWAKREGAAAIRKVLADDVPDLAVLNKEFAFWKSLQDVLTQTLQRTQPQGPGLARMLATTAGVTGGAATGGLTGLLTGGVVARQLQALVTSPRWRFASAAVRQSLADALAGGVPKEIQTAIARAAAALPAQTAPATTP